MLVNKKIDMSKKITILGLTLILFIQLFACLYFGTKKEGFYEDEIATYGLSSCPNALGRKDYEITWKSGKDYENLLIVNENTRFSYGMVYDNQVLDVHPPLYYFLIHSLESFFPGIFSKWIGIAPNILFCLLTTLLIFYISNQITKSRVISVCTAAFWALSIGGLSTAVFIRMYAMLTFFTTGLLALHVKIWKKLQTDTVLKYSDYVLLLLCTVAGILTQYYFMIFCFFLCGIFALYLLISRRWKLLFGYIFIETGAVVVSLLSFPAMLRHISSGYRGKEAFRNALSSEGTVERLKSVALIISRQNFSGWLKEFIIISVLSVTLIIVCRYFLHLKISYDKEEQKFIFNFDIYLERKFICSLSLTELPYAFVLVTAVGYYILVAKIAPYQADRYYMCIYPLVALLITKFIFMILCIFRSSMMKKIMAFVAVLVVITAVGQISQSVNYLYEDNSERNKLHDYKELPVIIINGTYDWYPNRWSYEYMEHPAVFRSKSYLNFEGLENVTVGCDLSGGFLLYACRTSMEEGELFSKIREFVPIASYEKIVFNGDPVYLCVSEAE